MPPNPPTAPVMISAKDTILLGVANRVDPMGVLAVWSSRARDLVPHLTVESTDIRGFQILVEAFRLWELYEPEHSEHAGRVADFFLLVEQAFARVVGWHDRAWPLPGARRVMARVHEDPPFMSVVDPGWHLLGAQLANGLWGIYRGASRRAGLLLEDMTQLSAETLEAATGNPGLGKDAQSKFFKLAKRVMNGATVELPTHLNSALAHDLYNTFHAVPLREHLDAKLLDGHALNLALAERLATQKELDYRAFMQAALRDLPEHHIALQNVIHCEDLLAVLESVFLWLCAGKGESVESAVEDMPVDLGALEAARLNFADSGYYDSATAQKRHDWFYKDLETSNRAALARSVIRLHQKISEARGRAAWVWEEGGVLCCDVEVGKPTGVELEIGVAWQNSYYLESLRRLSRDLLGRRTLANKDEAL